MSKQETVPDQPQRPAPPKQGDAPQIAATPNLQFQSRSTDVPANGITKVKPAGMRLEDSEARYRRLFEAAQDGILILDAKTGLITDVNPFLIKLLDYSREEFLGKELWEIGLFKDIEASKSAFRELQAKKYVRYEDLPLKTKDGRSINVEFVSNVYGVNGQSVIQCNVRDITKRKHTEQSEQQVQQTQKMEAIGQLAGGVAHDFNNLLGVILGYCEILEGRSDLASPTRKMITEIRNAGTSAKDLTKHLLAFSRRQALQPVLLDLNAAVTRVKDLLGRIIGDDIELSSVLCPDLGTIKADPSQVEQVLMNLVVNARDAMPNGGKIIIETSNFEIDDAFSSRHPSAIPGSYVSMSVRDTGAGMDAATQAHIFEPFFSTKAAGKGTGLGLSTVFGIVKQSSGTVSVSSDPNHGTTFTIRFPRYAEAAAVPQVEKTMLPCTGSETILLVDDAAPLRELTRQLLENCGYTVLDSGNPAEAMRIAREFKGPLPLMITDMEMPGFSGAVLAARLTADRPETKVLFTSGYFVEPVVDDDGPTRGSAFLEKPFTRDALVRKVREILDSPYTVALKNDSPPAVHFRRRNSCQ